MNEQPYLQWTEQIPWLQVQWAGNPVIRWLLALAAGVAALVLLEAMFHFCRRRWGQPAPASEREWNRGVLQVVYATKRWFLLTTAIYIGSLLLVLPERIRGDLHTVAVLALLLQAALWGTTLLKFYIDRSLHQRSVSDPALATTVSSLGFMGQLALWSVVLLLALANMGVDVTALVAGLGVGGIAVALAAQNILGDLFSSLSIVFDKPFVLGDFINVDAYSGKVEKIGLKTTHLRSLSGEQLIFANSDLLKSRVRNYTRMFERRAVFTIGVTYETPRDKLAAIPQMIRSLVEAQPQTRFDRAHFKEFGDSALLFEAVYFVLSPDYNLYMDVQQAINLGLMDQMAAADIEFAYPTQRLLLERSNSGQN